MRRLWLYIGAVWDGYMDCVVTNPFEAGGNGVVG